MSLTIQNLAISSLVPHQKNPRKIDDAIDAVARSIDTYGFLVPIVVDEQGVILAGHVRYHAAKKLKMEHIPTVCASNLTEDQKKAFMIADNKVAEASYFDNAILSELMADLKKTSFDVTLTGFDQSEIDNLLAFTVPMDLKSDVEDDSEDEEDAVLIPGKKLKLKVTVTCDDEDEQHALFIELRDRGYKVKV